ncbi:MAG: TonB-dependent receptor [Blastocatellia bacterium]
MLNRFVLLLCVLALTALTALGQEFRATLNGRVTDPAGASVPNATITVRNNATNENVTVTTNGEGNYTAPFLRPGVYTINVEASGFKKYTRDNQELQVSQTATVNIALEVGGANETVTVTADAALLDETKADRGNVIENRRIVELPLNARNPFMLATLTPGITFNGPAIYQRPFDNGAIADWSVNGGQNRNNEFLLDGAPNNSIQGGNNLAYVPPVDAVGEFKIITNSFDAQYGRTSGGIINVELKSGTNQYHGALYEFMRRNSFDANNLVANSKGIPAGRVVDPATGKFIPAEHFLDQYGGVIDGPIRFPKPLFGPLGGFDGRDKTFFMFNYEGYREGTPNPAIRTVPTEAFARGDFSQLKDAAGTLIKIYDPASATAANNFTRSEFAGNIIPANRINPVAAKVIQFFPKANTVPTSGDPWRNNFADLPNIADDTFKNWVFKIDQNVSAKDKAFFRYGYNNRKEHRFDQGITSGPGQSGQLPLNRINHTAVFDWVHTFNSSMILNIRTSANRYIEAARAEPGLDFDVTSLGFSSQFAAQIPQRIFPRFNFSDYSSIGRGSFSYEPTNVFSLQPNMTINKGSHTTRFGLDLRYTQYARKVSGNGAGVFVFDRTFTQKDPNRGVSTEGNSIAAFLLGAPTGLNSSLVPQSFVDYNAFPIYMFKYYAPWIQDDWKITRKLTLNLGFRWDLNKPAVERYNRETYGFDPTATNPATARVDKTKLLNGTTLLGGLGFVGGNNPNTPYKFDKKDLQPRIGFAYALNQKTVIRGGFGRYYLNPTGSPGFALNGYTIQTPLIASLDNNRTSLFNLSNPYQNGITVPSGSKLGLETLLGRTFSYSNPNFTVPYVHNFSLGVQRQLPFSMVGEISYVGSRTYNGQSQFNGINEPSQAFRDKCDIAKGGTPNFCNELLPNPFKGVAGFEGTAYYLADTLSRYNLNRPFPQFGAITELERNEGKVWYNSLQVLLNKRLAKGLSVSGNYTFSKSIEEATQLPGQQDSTASYIDDVAKLKNRSLSFADRPHRLTISGVWELPFGKGRPLLSNVNTLTDIFLGGWEMAGSYIFNSGRPWQLPGNVDIVDPNYFNVDSNRVVKGVQYIQGAKPCVAQYVKDSAGNYVRDASGKATYALTSTSVAAGCTSAAFVIREQYQTRVLPIRDAHIRRPSFEQIDINFSKNFRIGEKMRFQFRAEAYNLFNTPQYDERAYDTNTSSADFGGINKNVTTQSNFPRFFQLGFKFIF